MFSERAFGGWERHREVEGGWEDSFTMVDGGRDAPKTEPDTYNWLRDSTPRKNWDLHHSTHVCLWDSGRRETRIAEERKSRIASWQDSKIQPSMGTGNPLSTSSTNPFSFLGSTED